MKHGEWHLPKMHIHNLNLSHWELKMCKWYQNQGSMSSLRQKRHFNVFWLTPMRISILHWELTAVYIRPEFAHICSHRQRRVRMIIRKPIVEITTISTFLCTTYLRHKCVKRRIWTIQLLILLSEHLVLISWKTTVLLHCWYFSSASWQNLLSE